MYDYNGKRISGDISGEVGRMIDAAVELDVYYVAIRAEDRALRRAKKTAKKAAAPFVALKKALTKEVEVISSVSAWDIWADNYLNAKAAEATALADWQHGEKTEITAAVLSDVETGRAWESWVSPAQIKAAKIFNKAQAERLRALCVLHKVKTSKPNPQKYHLRKWAKKLNKNIVAYYSWLEDHDIFNAPRIVYRDNTGTIFDIQRFAAEENNNTATVVSSQKGGTNTGEAASAKKEEKKMFKNIKTAVRMNSRTKSNRIKVENSIAAAKRDLPAEIVEQLGDDFIFHKYVGNEIKGVRKVGNTKVDFTINVETMMLTDDETVAETRNRHLVGKDGAISRLEKLLTAWTGKKEDFALLSPEERENLIKLAKDISRKIKVNGLLGVKLEEPKTVKVGEGEFIIKSGRDIREIAQRVFSYMAQLELEATDFAAVKTLGIEKVTANVQRRISLRAASDMSRTKSAIMKRECPTGINISLDMNGNSAIAMPQPLEGNSLSNILYRAGQFRTERVRSGENIVAKDNFCAAILTLHLHDQIDWFTHVDDNGGNFRPIYWTLSDNEYRYFDGKLWRSVLTGIAISDEEFAEKADNGYYVYTANRAIAGAGDFKNMTINLYGTYYGPDKSKRIPWGKIAKSLSKGMYDAIREFEMLHGRKPNFEETATIAVRLSQWKATSKNFTAKFDITAEYYGKFASKKLGTDIEKNGEVEAYEMWDGSYPVDSFTVAEGLINNGFDATTAAVLYQLIQNRTKGTKGVAEVVSYRMMAHLLNKAAIWSGSEIINIIASEMTEEQKQWRKALLSNKGKADNPWKGKVVLYFKDRETFEKYEADKATWDKLNEKYSDGIISDKEYTIEGIKLARVQAIFDLNAYKFYTDIEREDGITALAFAEFHGDDGVTSTQMFRSLLLFAYEDTMRMLRDIVLNEISKAKDRIFLRKAGKVGDKDFLGYEKKSTDPDTGEETTEYVEVNFAEIAANVFSPAIRDYFPGDVCDAVNTELKRLCRMANNGNFPVSCRHYLLNPDPASYVAENRVLHVENGIVEVFAGYSAKEIASGEGFGVSIEEITRRVIMLDVTDEEKDLILEAYSYQPKGVLYVPAYKYVAKAGDGWDYDGDSAYVFSIKFGEEWLNMMIRYPKTHLNGFMILGCSENFRQKYAKCFTLCVDIQTDKLGSKKAEALKFDIETIRDNTDCVATVANRLAHDVSILSEKIKERAKNGEMINPVFVPDTDNMSLVALLDYALQNPEQVGAVIVRFTPVVDLEIAATILKNDQAFMQNYFGSVTKAYFDIKKVGGTDNFRNQVITTKNKLKIESPYTVWAITYIVAVMQAAFQIKPSTYDQNTRNYESGLRYRKNGKKIIKDGLPVVEVDLEGIGDVIKRARKINANFYVEDIEAIGHDFGAIVRFMAEGTIDQVKKIVASMIIGIKGVEDFMRCKMLSRSTDLQVSLKYDTEEHLYEDAESTFDKGVHVKYGVKPGDLSFTATKDEFMKKINATSSAYIPKSETKYVAVLRDTAFAVTAMAMRDILKFAEDSAKEVQTLFDDESIGLPEEEINEMTALFTEKDRDLFRNKVGMGIADIIQGWRSIGTTIRQKKEELFKRGLSTKSPAFRTFMDAIKADKKECYNGAMNEIQKIFANAGIEDPLKRARVFWISQVLKGSDLKNKKVDLVKLEIRLKKITTRNMMKEMCGKEYFAWMIHLNDIWAKHQADNAEVPAAVTYNKVKLEKEYRGWDKLSILDGKEVLISNGTIALTEERNLGTCGELDGEYTLRVEDDTLYACKNMTELLPEAKVAYNKLLLISQAYINGVKPNSDINPAGETVYVISTKNGNKKKRWDMRDDNSDNYVRSCGVFVMRNGELQYICSYRGGSQRPDDFSPALQASYGVSQDKVSAIKGTCYARFVASFKGNKVLLLTLKNVERLTEEEATKMDSLKVSGYQGSTTEKTPENQDALKEWAKSCKDAKFNGKIGKYDAIFSEDRKMAIVKFGVRLYAMYIADIAGAAKKIGEKDDQIVITGIEGLPNQWGSIAVKAK